MVNRGGPIIRSPFGRVPLPGTAQGNQKRDEFEARVLDICGTVELFYLPRKTETTTSTDRSLNARTFTYDADVASRYSPQGSGVGVAFDGTDDEADVADAASLSFGDGVYDEPFSIVAWLNQTASAAIKSIFAKWNAAGTLREWQLALDASEKLQFQAYDESADTSIGRLYNTALGTGSILNVGMTYDGSRAATGIRLYSAGARVDDTDASSGAYVAMEGTATVVRLGSSGSAATPAEFLPGTLYCAILARKALTQDELWQLKLVGNAFFNLSL